MLLSIFVSFGHFNCYVKDKDITAHVNLVVYKQVNAKWQNLSDIMTKSDIPSKILYCMM